MTARGQVARNLRAAERLRAEYGITAPAKGAEYRLRVEQGRARGISKAQAYGQAARAKVESVSSLRKAGKLAPPVRHVPGGTRSVKLGGSVRVTDTTSGDQVLRALKAARSRGSNVVIRARYETEKGIRTLTADGRTGKKTAVIDGTTPVGPVQVTEIASGLKTGGLSGRKLDALIAAWSEEGADALYDVIEQEYEEGEYS